MSFFALYRKACKPPDSEELVDAYVFRPLAYPIARALLPARAITPTQITVASIAVGAAASAALVAGRPALAAALLLATNVLDCVDGMLARLRGTSSALGRMLDGVADMVWTALFSAATLVVVWRAHPGRGLAVAVAGALVVATSAAQLALFDQHRNRWLRFTRPDFREEDGEPAAAAERRWREARAAGAVGPAMWIVWRLYLAFVRGQERLNRWFDPHAAELRAHDPESAERYRRRHALPWWLFRLLFGSSSLAAGLAVAAAAGGLDVYLMFRLVALNALFVGVAAPLTRRASLACARAS